MSTSVFTDTGRAEPSANKKKAVPTCGVKKSSGSLVMSFRAWEPQWARTCTGASSTEVLVTGALPGLPASVGGRYVLQAVWLFVALFVLVLLFRPAGLFGGGRGR